MELPDPVLVPATRPPGQSPLLPALSPTLELE